MNRLHVRPGVDDDIYELAAHLIDRNEETARRFVDAAQKTLKDIANRPGMGSPKDFGDDPTLQAIRSWRVDEFPIISFITAWFPMALRFWRCFTAPATL